jgi:hypothetical protein
MQLHLSVRLVGLRAEKRMDKLKNVVVIHSFGKDTSNISKIYKVSYKTRKWFGKGKGEVVPELN